MADRRPAPTLRRPHGLYDPQNEHDACGVACLARLDGVPIHDVVERALSTLDHLEHRGAEGADPETGDGAGILLQVQPAFLRARAADFGVEAGDVPDLGAVALGMCFLPHDEARRAALEAQIAAGVEADGHRVLGWRDVPIDPEAAGRISRQAMPKIRQVLIARGEGCPDQDSFERRLYIIRRRLELAHEDLYFPSFSSRTVVYKGMLTAPQLRAFYADLRDPELISALAIVHSRFSTNTFPSWPLAHPHRMVAHNGEINTLAGNINWTQAREAILSSPLFGEELRECLPLVKPGMSDSAAFDHVFELLTLGGRSLPHAAMMMIPRAWEGRQDLPQELVDFYRYHSRLMEAWDGPAAIVFTDGRVLGATLDRNGLRPGRWVVTTDGWVALSSETGAFNVPDEEVERRGRLHPGAMFIVDLDRGRVLDENEAELEVARSQPWGQWDDERTVHIRDLDVEPDTDEHKGVTNDDLRTRQLAFGYTQEDVRIVLTPMARDGKEPTGSMGADVALAMLSERSPSLFAYFKQRFAQVTNPAIDPIRERVVMSLRTSVGPEANLFEDPDTEPQLELDGPVIMNEQTATLRRLDSNGLRAKVIDITWPLSEGEAGMAKALERIREEASAAIADGYNLLVLSDRALGPDRVPVPALLATSAVHHHLVDTGERVRAGLVVESGEPREVHHVACLIGFGANAVNPYTMLDTVSALAAEGEVGHGVDGRLAREHTIEALNLGLLKVLSKMGISTIKSYTGAKIFEAVGLDREVIERYFPNTHASISGVGVEALAREALDRHARAFPREHGFSVRSDVERALLPVDHERILPQGGVYQWRRDGERHMWDPDTIANLQRAARNNGDARLHYSIFAERVNEENARHGLIRGLVRTRPLGPAIPIDEVEPVSEILKRFSTGAMSLGALSPEAHETLAIAMNRIGGRSNSGEGGEDARRYRREPNGDWKRSAIKQVASGRFGVTAHYLANSDQIQIKIAQGAKPGEGGQLPGHKVDEYIAQLRHSTPGVELISPPPHHDIYSIEDLKQLIYDLRTSNPNAEVSVKLASELGVGTVAAGVVKAGADHVVIAGHDGGTGASPQSSIHSAGVPWEIGLAETQHTLIENHLRTRVQLQIDGQMRTGRDVVIAALLGADEYGFSTAPLVATGCIMMRVCHLNTCPVGVATQDPELRRRFAGKPEHVVNYLVLVAEEVRQLLAELGAHSLEEIIGRADLLATEHAIDHWKAGGVDLSDLLAVPDAPPHERRFVRAHLPEREDLDPLRLLDEARTAIHAATPITIQREILNLHRAVGGVLSHEVAAKHGPAGLPDETIRIELHGSAGQSLGAWLAAGISIDLQGDANDYVGKGLSGGILTVRPPEGSKFVAEDNVIAGNVILYGATGGRAFFRGRVGERFAIRNSGAKAVVEGVGDHGCEYMTGGVVVVIGPTGHNFAAGMTGGVAYVWDPDGTFPERCNRQLVDLDPLEDEDRAELRELLVEHHARTDSAVAERILEGGEAAIEQFVKVMPREYKRIINERKQVGTVGAQA
ncbi:MAG TPA: glutamate synthase large subunit [Solirubrobacterales bacterium]